MGVFCPRTLIAYVRRYETAFGERGVSLYPGTTVTHVDVDAATGAAQSVGLNTGEKCDASLVVAGVGSRVDLSLFDGLQTAAGGIKVNGA